MTSSPKNSAGTSKAGKWVPEGLRESPARAWLVAAGLRRGFLLVSTAPVTLGAFLAIQEGAPFRYVRFATLLVCVWAYHVGANLLNEYYDFLSGTDRFNKVQTPFSGGTRVLVDDILAPEMVRNVGWTALVLGLAGFFILGSVSDDVLIAFGLFGFLAPILYSVEPIWLAYRGLGEILLGLAFGPALVGCAYYAMAETLTASSLILGAAMGLLAAAVLTINEIPDRVADEEVGKRTLVVILGRHGGLVLHGVILLLGTGLPILGAAVSRMPRPFYLFAIPLVAAVLLVSRGKGNLEPLPSLVFACRSTILIFVGSWLVGLAAIGIAFVWG